MGIFDKMAEMGHEQLVFCYDKATGLRMIIGVHDTTLGPALGGCRMWPYESEEAAIEDVMRLSRGMTYKNSAMGLRLGGGKTVVLQHERGEKDEMTMRAIGRFVETLGGRYVTAEDVGTSVQDMAIAAEESRSVRGLPEASGDPSIATAYGVYMALKASLQEAFGSEEVRGRKIAVQGLGHVGVLLCEQLHKDGAELYVTDIDQARIDEAVRRFDAHPVAPDAIYDQPCDVYSPCALGATLNDDTIPRLKVKVVVGSANNQLKEPRHGKLLQERGIVYAPDFVANGGGVINVADEMHPDGYHKERAFSRVAQIYDRMREIFRIAREQGIAPHEAADHMAEERIARIAAVNRMFIPRR
ncbi:MAG: leucine dehydrogenase [Thermaerobacter sp.]|nr:leucine dehydrogenase [Thermaerobacter sp.]